jgi:hypothetical protein
MMKYRHFVAFVLVAGVLVGCSSNAGNGNAGNGNAGNSNSARPDTGTRTSGLDASWAEHYSTVSDLKKHSDIAVQGTISQLVGDTTDAKGIPSRTYQFVVSATVYDPEHRLTGSAPTITLRQTGGVANGVTFQVGDDPLYKVGDEAVLFLKEGSPGVYHVVGGPNGRYSVANGKVTAFNAETATAPEGAVSTFIADVKKTN